MKPNHSNSDNLKEQIGDILYKYNDIDGHYDFEPATDELLQLYKDYAMGCVPPNDAYRLNSFAHKLYAPSEDYAEGFKTGYQKCRQDILTKIKESK